MWKTKPETAESPQYQENFISFSSFDFFLREKKWQSTTLKVSFEQGIWGYFYVKIISTFYLRSRTCPVFGQSLKTLIIPGFTFLGGNNIE